MSNFCFIINCAEITNIILSSRSLKILAESYAIKGLCLENKELQGSSKFKQAERESEMVTNK